MVSQPVWARLVSWAGSRAKPVGPMSAVSIVRATPAVTGLFLPKMSVATAVTTWWPSARVWGTANCQWPPFVWPISTPSMKIVTVLQAGAVPRMTGAGALVAMGAITGASRACAETATGKAAESAVALPELAYPIAVTWWTPSARGLASWADQAPLVTPFTLESSTPST
ncbi:hypothetical protein D3C72_728440 [compost metagenome]